MSRNTIVLDVREDIRGGREPFSRIMSTVASLGNDHDLLLVAPFEPVPLVHLLTRQGFRHTKRTTETGDCEVLFVREQSAQNKSAVMTTSDACSVEPPAKMLEVDARGLDPPLPMVKILEALCGLPADAGLSGRTDRRPIHLYAQLEERGFVARTEEQPDGSFVTHIVRR